MLNREHVCIEIGNPLLALLRHSEVAQRICDIRSHGFRDRRKSSVWALFACVSHPGPPVTIRTSYSGADWIPYDVAPSFYPAAIGVWRSTLPSWAVMTAVRGAEPSV